jgi:hypothetical protein
MYLKENLETWVRGQREGIIHENGPPPAVEPSKRTVYHRNALFVLPSMNIRRVPTSKGLRSILTYWYRGIRYRPVLGLNLSADQERDAALQVISAIHANVGQHGVSPVLSPSAENQDLRRFPPDILPIPESETSGCRQSSAFAVRLHLLPFCGLKRLDERRLEDGLAYLEHRRAQGAADGTIEGECAVLMAILNLAVDFEALDKNRLRRLPVPSGSKRERIIEPQELHKLQQVASHAVWRAAMVDLQTGLRVNKLVETHVGMGGAEVRGYWLYPSPGMLRGEPLPGSAKYYIQTGTRRCAMRSRNWRHTRDGF